jgi:hypothetical protein
MRATIGADTITVALRLADLGEVEPEEGNVSCSEFSSAADVFAVEVPLRCPTFEMPFILTILDA